MAQHAQPSRAGEHVTEIGSDLAARLAAACCSCGWSTIQGFARVTGEPVALRLVQLKAERHEHDPAATTNGDHDR